MRKTTFDTLNEKLKDKINFSVSKDNLNELDDYAIDKIAEFLNIQKNSIEKENVPVFIHHTKEEIVRTKRKINREVYIFIIITLYLRLMVT